MPTFTTDELKALRHKLRDFKDYLFYKYFETKVYEFRDKISDTESLIQKEIDLREKEGGENN